MEGESPAGTGARERSGRGGAHGVVRRAASVIRVLAATPREGAAGADVARAAQLPLQTVHRLLTELGREGYARQVPSTKRWTLGPELVVLGALAQQQVDWTPHVHHVLADISRESGETTVFTVRSGTHATIVELAESPQPLRLNERRGLRLPLTVGASRRVVLALLGQDEHDEILTRLESDGTVVDRAELDRDRRRVADSGFLVTTGVTTAHTMGIAVPIVVEGRPVGSLMTAGPVPRLSPADAARHAEVLRRRVADLVALWAALRGDVVGAERRAGPDVGRTPPPVDA